MRACGFPEARAETITVRRGLGASDYLEKVRAKFISTLALMDEPEFARGVAALEAAIRGGRPLDLTWHGMLVLART